MPDNEKDDGDNDSDNKTEQEDVQIDTEWQVRHREDGGEKR